MLVRIIMLRLHLSVLTLNELLDWLYGRKKGEDAYVSLHHPIIFSCLCPIFKSSSVITFNLPSLPFASSQLDCPLFFSCNCRQLLPAILVSEYGSMGTLVLYPPLMYMLVAATADNFIAAWIYSRFSNIKWKRNEVDWTVPLMCTFGLPK